MFVPVVFDGTNRERANVREWYEVVRRIDQQVFQPSWEPPTLDILCGSPPDVANEVQSIWENLAYRVVAVGEAQPAYDPVSGHLTVCLTIIYQERVLPEEDQPPTS